MNSQSELSIVSVHRAT